LTGVDQESRFFFAHVQKAAGTSLFVRLQRQFPREQIYPDASDTASGAADDGAQPALPRLTSTLLVSRLVERYRARRDEIRVVTGHFPLRTTELLGDEFTTLTLVRDPVERTLSALRHQQVKAPADRDRSLEELYDDPIRFHGLIHNHMVKVFSLSPEEIVAGDGIMARVDPFTTARFEEAKARLAGVDVLGLHDHLEEFCAELGARFGWQLGSHVHANRTEPVEVAPSFRARIASDNALDLELYEHAEQLWSSRRAEGAPGSARASAG
jgi:hypothetical protein